MSGSVVSTYDIEARRRAELEERIREEMERFKKEREKLLAKGEDQYEINSKGQNKVNATARANVRNKFSNRYREQYKEAYKNRDTVTVAKIKTRLSLTRLYDDLDRTLEEWRNSADEEVKKEKRAKEYNEKNK